MKRSWVVLITLMVLSGCNRASEVTLISRADLPDDIYGSPSPSPSVSSERELVLHFIRDGSLVVSKRVSQSTKSPLEATLESLLEGTVVEEAALGLRTEIPSDVQLIQANVSGETATVDLSGEFESGAEQQVLILRLAQIVFSATSVSGISQVRILIDGARREVLVSDGSLVSRPVTRADYSEIGSRE